MFNTLDILVTVGVLILLILPGYILRKRRMVFRTSLGTLSAILLYVCQPMLCLKVFALAEVDERLSLASNMAIMALVSFAVQLIGFLIAKLFFIKSADKNKKKIYVFASMFGNCGFIGIPIIAGITGGDPVAQIYAAIFIAMFNMLLWTLGIYIITGDVKAIKPQKALLNPPTIALLPSCLLFFLPQINFFTWHSMLSGFLQFFGDMTTPLSMIIIGIRLADMPLRDIFTDIGSYVAAALKLALIPVVGFVLLLPLQRWGVFGGVGGEWILPVVFVMLALPPAASTVAFCERFKGDAVTAVKTFLLGTLFSAATLPLVLQLMRLV